MDWLAPVLRQLLLKLLARFTHPFPPDADGVEGSMTTLPRRAHDLRVRPCAGGQSQVEIAFGCFDPDRAREAEQGSGSLESNRRVDRELALIERRCRARRARDVARWRAQIEQSAIGQHQQPS